MIDTDPQRNTTNVYKSKTEGVATLYDNIFFSAVIILVNIAIPIPIFLHFYEL